MVHLLVHKQTMILKTKTVSVTSLAVLCAEKIRLNKFLRNAKNSIKMSGELFCPTNETQFRQRTKSTEQRKCYL